MKESKELIFEVMVMYEDILEKAIMQHNHWNDTDFEIIEVIYDDLIFC
ncbi:conserved hypothetical protein [Capnocytophaga canimorsus]|nr:hypothetical protein [Capnocytophaga canimorsus]CEN49094.1 conserved hypothetical protein [Capnocytophaga canimorsus]